MGQGDTTVWTNWIREETDEIMKQLEEERDSRSDPDDPFNGTVNGVFLPLQDPLSLPPPVQTPKRQENNSENSEHSRNLRENIRGHVMPFGDFYFLEVCQGVISFWGVCGGCGCFVEYWGLVCI